MAKFRLICNAFTRITAAGVAVLSIFCIPECQKLLNNNFFIRGNTLFVPLSSSCTNHNEPTSIVTSDGTILYGSQINMNVDHNDIYTIQEEENVVHCDDAKDLLFVHATQLSLFLSVLALTIFLLTDLLSQCKRKFFNNARCCKWLKPSLSIGMGLFVIFILLQTGFSTLGLVQECQWWKHIYQDFLENTIASSNGNNLDVDNGEQVVTKAQPHGNVILLTATAYSAFVASGLVFLDGVIQLFTYTATNTSSSSKDDLGKQAAGISNQLTDDLSEIDEESAIPRQQPQPSPSQPSQPSQSQQTQQPQPQQGQENAIASAGAGETTATTSSSPAASSIQTNVLSNQEEASSHKSNSTTTATTKDPSTLASAKTVSSSMNLPPWAKP